MAEKAGREFAAEPSPLQCIWESLKSEGGPWKTKGQKVVKSRFMAFTRRARREMAVMAQRSFCYQYTCLELDMLGAKKVIKLTLRPDIADDPASGTTDSKRLTSEEKILRNSCQNTMVISCLMYGNMLKRQRLAVALACVEGLEKWHQEQNRRLRSVDEVLTWSLQQLSGKFMESVASILAPCASDKDLEEIGFTMIRRNRPLPDGFDIPELTSVDDDLATLMSGFALSLAGRRIARALWFLRGWPSRSVLLLSEDERIAKEAIQLFRSDEANHAFLCSQATQVSGLDALVRRSTFDYLPVQQDFAVLRDNNFLLTEQVVSYIKANHRRLNASQVCEDGFREQKLGKKNPAKHTRIQKAFSAVIDRKVLSERHDFTEVLPSACPDARDDILPWEMYSPPIREVNPTWKELTQSAEKPPWYSPKACNWPSQYGDLSAVAFARSRGQVDLLQDRWLGQLLAPKHHILVRHRVTGTPDRWSDLNLPLGLIPDSCAILWGTVQECSPEPNGGSYYVPRRMPPKHEAMLIPVVNLAEWEAIHIEWHAPWWQAAEWPSARDRFKQWKLVATPSGVSRPLPLLQVAARRGFFGLPLDFIIKIATHQRIDLPVVKDLFSVLWVVVQSITQFSDDEVLDIMMLRLAEMMGDHDFTDRLLQLDDAHECLDKFDQRALKSEKTTSAVAAETRRHFANAVRDKRRALHPPPAPAPKAKGRGKGGKPGPAPAALRVLPDGVLEQAVLKPLTPCGGYIWRANTKGAWMCRYPPQKSFSAYWNVNGPRAAAILCLQHLWQWHIRLGFADDCPIEGLMENMDVPDVPDADDMETDGEDG